jgi:hypothetical protein
MSGADCKHHSGRRRQLFPQAGGDTAVYSVSKAYYQPDPSARMCGYNVDAVGTPGVGIADNRSNFFIEGLLLVQ